MPSRRLSRCRAVQVLYECDLRNVSPEDALRDYYASLYSEENEARPEPDYFLETLALGAHSRRDELDAMIGAAAENWKVDRMPVVDRNVLRMALYELLHAGTPVAVVIDEAIEVARRYSGDDAARFVNGVLDAIAKKSGGGAGA
jgi:transcription antitermination protein NusB